MAGELASLLIPTRSIEEIVDSLGRTSSTLVTATAGQSFILASLAYQHAGGPFLVVTATESEAEQLVGEIACFLEDSPIEPIEGDIAGSVALFPAWQTLPFERVSPDVATMGQRLAIRHLLAEPTDAPPRVIVASVKALLQRLTPRTEVHRPLLVRRGDEIDAQSLLESLVERGYRRELQVEHRGEFSMRGGIIDLFPPTTESPFRIDLFGDEVERLTKFDVVDQRSVADVEQVAIFGCRELVVDEVLATRARQAAERELWAQSYFERLSRGESFDSMESWLPWLSTDEELLVDRLGARAQLVLVDPRRVKDRAIEVIDEEAALAASLAQTWGARGDDRDNEFPRLHVGFDRLLARCEAAMLSLLSVPEGPSTPVVSVRANVSAGGDPERIGEMVRDLCAKHKSVTVCSPTRQGAQRIQEILAGEGVTAILADAAEPTNGVRVVVSRLHHGVSIPQCDIAVIGDGDSTGRRSTHRAPRPRARPVDGFFDDLAPGGFVIHYIHGVARYSGMTTRTVAGVTRDYLILEFRGGDKIFLPIEQINLIVPYSGGDSPTLSKMGGSDWQRTRSKARAAAAEVAEGLVALYRRRLQEPGIAFGPDTAWQAEMEAAFPYTETADQIRAVEEVKADMELARPMDRLVCGDVGFGKTEVAIRAVFKAVQDGHQAAVLVPTTLLASQHFATFSERYAGYPVRIAMLSRFLTTGEANKVVCGLADGTIDVVIATHRLLGANVKFNKLGLLVIDEEQRFGVNHKESIKELAAGIDVLTLSASPIPRTLEMSLTGIRDLSLVNTPPSERRPILTYVGSYDEAAVSEAIRRELLREGQVFFLHNRVADIERVAANLRALVPEAKVAVAHGQMDEGSLERVVLDFAERRYNVLVCTTIIESGIDMPSVNTLVVDRADMLGLGQLHQIRGRVGRGGQRAYAYFFHPPERALSEIAYERLRTIGENTELGAGFKIAMRDLEIRGAGNLLGNDQSGHIAAVGYDLYVSMVAEAVNELKGVPREILRSVALDLPQSAHLPVSYVEAEDARLEAYRRVGQLRSYDELQDLQAEWIDRFGPLPDAAESLIDIARLRVAAIERGVRDITLTKTVRGSTKPPLLKVAPIELATSAQVRLRRLHPDATYSEETKRLTVALRGAASATQVYDLLVDLVPSSELVGEKTIGTSVSSGRDAP